MGGFEVARGWCVEKGRVERRHEVQIYGERRGNRSLGGFILGSCVLKVGKKRGF